MKNIIEKISTWAKGLTRAQVVTLGVCSVLVIAIAVSVGVLVSKLGSKQTVGTEVTEATEAIVVEQETETQEVILTNISITTTSIGKDLKVKIVDENNTLVSGQPFVIMVAPVDEDAEFDPDSGTAYEDDDMDGIIYISSIEGGDYTVYLQEIEGFTVLENPITATVKESVSYQKVDVSNEIKDEKDINAAIEDTAQNNVKQEAELVDSVALIETSVSTTAVTKDVVDLSLFPAASVSTSSNSVTVNGTATTATISLPSTVTMYYYGSQSSMNSGFSLSVTDADGIIKELAWENDNTSAVTLTVDESTNTASLVAKQIGTANISVTVSYVSDENDTVSTEKITCTVTVGEHTDKKIHLTDKDGNLLYTDSDAKIPATPANYNSATTLYSNPLYTGWQSFDGYLYYYGPDNVAVTGTQVIGGVQYEFHEDGKLKESEQSVGIDVSKWQGDIDWKAVANAGIDFAIIRCGYRGSSTGVLAEDSYFKQNIKGATENGIKVGVYYFTQAITEAEAVEEASAAIALVQGYKLHFPIFIDTEGSGGRADSLDKATRTAIVKAFCETVRNSGYKPGIYASKYWYYDKLDVSQLSTYNIWVAQYNTECNYNGRYDMWQYSSKGSVPGISTNVDMNICYTKY